MLDRQWLSNNGPLVQEFEKRIAEYVGVKHAIAVCNGTVALELAAKALDLKGEVIIPSYTFVATAHALQWQGIRPVFADINQATHNLDPAAVEVRITGQTSAIVGVHLWGRPCPVESLQELADRHRLALMFDASHAFGCSHKGRMIGNFGACEVFSFHATKFLNSFEGGAITTNCDNLAVRLRKMKNFGFEGYDNVSTLGTNGKMPEICAAMGLTGLDSIADFIANNRRNYDAYRESLKGMPGIELMPYDPEEAGNFQYIIVELADDLCSRRDEVVDALHSGGVLARKYFWPGCHRMMPYRELYPEEHRHLGQTERVAARVIVLPTGMSVETADIERICGIIGETVTGRING
jgi:dTDP-4-amino-4,6-dideoxygalactose transaminase